MFDVMTLPPLTYRHKFKSGRVVKLLVSRKLDTLPVLSSEGFEELHGLERAEYFVWRQNVVKTMWKTLTPGEQEKCEEHGRKIVEARKK